MTLELYDELKSSFRSKFPKRVRRYENFGSRYGQSHHVYHDGMNEDENDDFYWAFNYDAGDRV